MHDRCDESGRSQEQLLVKAAPEKCPTCQKKGQTMLLTTVRAVLNPDAMRRCLPETYCFCQTSDCPVVYFGQTNCFEIADLRVPVFQKSTAADIPVCYCFGFSRDDLAAPEGHLIPQHIQTYVKNKQCACELRNPQGRCCLGNIRQVLCPP